MRVLLRAALLSALFIPSVVFAEPVKRTLNEFYKLALEKSEALKRRTEEIRVAEANYDQAVALLYPKINFIATQQFRDAATGSNNNIGDSTSNFSSNSRSKHPFDTRFSVSQPLFTGFRYRFLADAAEQDKQVARYEEKRFAETLYVSIAELFYQINLYQSDLRLYERTSDVLNERIAELKHFIELGKSRDSEILAAESEHSDLDAIRERTKGLLNTSKEMMAFFSGLPSQEIAVSTEETVIQPVPLEILIQEGKGRADVLAQERRVSSAEYQSKAAERLRWPTLFLEGNVYPYEEPDRDQDASVLFRLDVPLYQGGALVAQAEEQKARLRQNQLTLEELRRQIESDIRVLYTQLETSRNQVAKLKTLFNTAQQSLKSQRKDYELGVVTNLDVLQAIRSVYDAENRLLAVQAEMKINYARLKVAVGGIS